MRNLLVVGMVIFCSGISMAQVDTANYSERTSTIDQTIASLYDVISGGKGEERDWDFLRFLFHPEARLVASGRRKSGEVGAKFVTVEEYIRTSGEWMLENGFYEHELYRVTEQFGHIAHAFTSYECFHSEDDTAPFMRGINSVQLMYTGRRWMVMGIFFTQESEDNPIPEKYLPEDRK
jgi:hypothetical protein